MFVARIGFRCWVEIHILFNPSLKNRHLNDKPPPFCGMKFLHSNSPPKNGQPDNPQRFQRRKTTSTTFSFSTGPKALIKVVHPLPGWRWLPEEICPLVFGQLEGGSKFYVHVPKEICSTTFFFKGCKKYSGGKKVAFAMIFRFLDAFAWFVFIIVWLERFRISMKHCQGKDVFQILVDLYTQFESFPVKLNRVFHRFNKVSLHVSPMRSHHSYHPGWKGPNLKHCKTLLNCTCMTGWNGLPKFPIWKAVTVTLWTCLCAANFLWNMLMIPIFSGSDSSLEDVKSKTSQFLHERRKNGPVCYIRDWRL